MASKLQDCDCGFVDSNDPTKSVFTSFLFVNFSSITSKQLGDLFIPATYQISQNGSPYTRNFSAGQLQLSDAGLELTVSPPSDSQNVPCAQLFSRAATFSYGSYSAQFRVGSVPGTVTAFFNYKNDSSEVDVEYLSSWADPTLLYSTKPQIYLADGSPSNSTFAEGRWNSSAAAFDQDFHEWSFVWLPDVVHYGLDANYSRSLTTNVPQAPGRIALSHWSDGNPNYSLGPPTQNSTVVVSTLQAVYNDTNATALTCKKATSPCAITNGIFQAGPGSGGHAITDATISINSAPLASPAATGWLFALLLFSWLRCWRLL